MKADENDYIPKEEEQVEHKEQTPHRLAAYQIEDDDYQITDEDMENMDISTELSEQENNKSKEEAEELEKNTISSSYDMLD